MSVNWNFFLVRRRLLTVAICMFSVACSHTWSLRTEHGSGESGEGLSAPLTPEELARDQKTGEELEKSTLNKPGDKIPIEVNHHVNRWIDYFQGRGSKHMARYLSRSSRYIPMMKQILREEGLPEDLVYIALIESGFNHSALSRANAVGYWQFIRATGKSYGLQINALVDERRDPVRSTQAAAQYFKSLYNLFGDWYLAIASYNVGENRIKRLVMKHQTRDFWDLVRKRGLPRETRDYVPKFLAATMIAKDPARYGFTDIEGAEPLRYVDVEATQPIHLKKLAENMQLSYEEIKSLNMQFRSEYAPLAKDARVLIRVPVDTKERAIASLPNSTYDTTRQIADLEKDYFYYRVRHGDTLSGIARRFRSRVSVLRKLNNMGNKSFLRVGHRIKVPVNDDSAYRYLSGSSKVEKIREPKIAAKKVGRSSFAGRRIHVVRRGDTLLHIAKHYGTTMVRLAEQNKISNRSKLFVGAKLVIPD